MKIDVIPNMFTSRPTKKYNLKVNCLKLDIIIEEFSQNKAMKRKKTDEDEKTIICNYGNKKLRFE